MPIEQHANNRLYHFDELNEEIFQIYIQEGLLSLSEVREDDKHIDNMLNEAMNVKVNINPFTFSPFKMQDEMNSITKDIKYVTGMLFFLHPYIVDTVEDRGRYLQNLPDRRYVMYANFGLQAFYNFWDRIGDVLYMYFDTGLPERQAYLGMILNNIKPEYKRTAEYEALNELYTDKIKPFLGDRNDAVHNYQLENRYYWGAIQYRQAPEEARRLNDEKHALPGKFKEHLGLCIEGFKLTVALLNILPDDPEVITIRAQVAQAAAEATTPTPASDPDPQQ